MGFFSSLDYDDRSVMHNRATGSLPFQVQISLHTDLYVQQLLVAVTTSLVMSGADPNLLEHCATCVHLQEVGHGEMYQGSGND